MTKGPPRRTAAVALCVALALGAVGTARASLPYPTVHHTLAWGETLADVAARFGVTVEALAAANGIADLYMLAPGRALVLPSPEPATEPASVYVVQPGDTLFGIATRFGTTVEALAAANGIADPANIQAGQSLTIPGSSATAATVGAGPIRSVDARPAPVAQGQVLVITAHPDAGALLDGWLDGQRLAFSRDGDLAFALVPVGFSATPGARQLVVWARTSPADAVRVSLTVQVREGTFESSLVTIPPDRTYLLDPALLEQDRLQLERAFGMRTARKLWTGEFLQPVQGAVTTSFGAYREYNDGRRESRHGGIDLSAPTGTPVLAANAGRVVFAGALQVYGNGIVIDHGLGVCSAYFHLHTIAVQAGQSVQKGEVIGTVGNTGLSTGAHLHWEMRLGNVPVNPTQWLSQSIP